MTTKAISRRKFAGIIGAGAAYAALKPSISSSAALRMLSETRSVTTGVVRLSSNENPYGPSPKALTAMAESFNLAWRYPDEHADLMVEEIAKLHNVSSQQILLGNGSGEILNVSAAAYSGAGKKVVTADPTYEAISFHARAARAEVAKIRLTSDYRHDLPKMLAAASDAGLIYICNPNNPTASVTPRKEIRAFLSRVSPQTVVLVDEAYHHYVETDDYETLIPLVKQYPNLIVARTFSKIYGMAGLRCGYCVTQPDNVQRLRAYQSWDSLNIMALMAALASLKDAEHVEQGRRKNSEVKGYTHTELEKLGYHCIPSHTNFLMVDMRRDVKPVIAAFRRQGIEVGRFFLPLPNFMRVTIGTRPQMETFVAAFRAVASATTR